MDRPPSLSPRLPAVLAALVLSGACAVIPAHADDPGRTVRGPIPARSLGPAKLTTLAFRPRRATITPAETNELTLLSAYANMSENGDSGGDSVTFDGEIWRTSAIFRRAVGPGADVEIELPILYATSGFLDQIVEDFHSFFGFPNGGRDQRPQFDYDMVAVKNGVEAYRLEGNELGLGDVPIVLTVAIQEEGKTAPALALRAGIEIPSGSEGRGFGNGELDWGLGFLAERSLGRWTATGAIDWIDAQSSRSFERAGVEAEDGLGLQLGAEYRWNDDLSLLAGGVYSPPATRDIPLEEIEAASLSLDLGLAWDVGSNSRILLDFSEDLITESAPDFTVLAAWTVSL